VHCLLKISAQHSIYNNKCTKNLDYNHHILKAKMSWGKSARRREIIRILSSLHFNGHFSRHIWVKLVPEMSPSWILLEPSMIVTAGAIRPAKLQQNRNHQQTNTQFFFTGLMP